MFSASESEPLSSPPSGNSMSGSKSESLLSPPPHPAGKLCIRLRFSSSAESRTALPLSRLRPFEPFLFLGLLRLAPPSPFSRFSALPSAPSSAAIAAAAAAAVPVPAPVSPTPFASSPLPFSGFSAAGAASLSCRRRRRRSSLSPSSSSKRRLCPPSSATASPTRMPLSLVSLAGTSRCEPTPLIRRTRASWSPSAPPSWPSRPPLRGRRETAG